MNEEKIKCQNCGTENNIGDKYCKECGHNLNKEVIKNLKQYESKNVIRAFFIEFICFMILNFFTSFWILDNFVPKGEINQWHTFFIAISNGIILGLLPFLVIWCIAKFNILEKHILELKNDIAKGR